MKNNIDIDISPPIPDLPKFWFSSYGPKCYRPIKLQNSLKCNISRKKWMMKFIFGTQINIEVFYKLILSFWVYVARHAQSIQYKKFAYLCDISGKALGCSWFFCLQLNAKVFYKLIVSLWVCVDRNVQPTQNDKFEISLQYSELSIKRTLFLPKESVRFIETSIKIHILAKNGNETTYCHR